MTIRRFGWWLLYALAGAAALYAVSCAAVGTYQDGRIAAACISAGYPEHQSTYNLATLHFTGYCVKRVNQTDSVVALSKLR